MSVATKGSTVTIHYIGTLDNGKIFDSTQDDEPLVFVIGSDAVFPALQKAIIGMAPGETKNIMIPAAEAFGPRLQENIIKVERPNFPSGKVIEVGKKLSVEFSAGSTLVMMVTEVNDHEVTLDGNHPLAGLDLTFALRLESVA
ncbi:MAG: FKBP-type peptidyl-prolyl cis-trans isomerase [Geobacteraceae bacterium]